MIFHWQRSSDNHNSVTIYNYIIKLNENYDFGNDVDYDNEDNID